MIRQLRQKAAEKLWATYHKVADVEEERRMGEQRVVIAVLSRLPTPSWWLRKVNNLIGLAAWEVDEMCPRCGGSPCPGYGKDCDEMTLDN